MDDASDNTLKKDPFETLSREELIKKCKHFLGIAQKAKQVKDDLAEENKSLTNALTKLEHKSHTDIQTIQETLNALTEQKLEFVTENDMLKNRVHSLENKIKQNEKSCEEFQVQIQVLDTENQSLNRQNKRLSEENDQLIKHLEVLEKQIDELNKIGEQQRMQLLTLEKQDSMANRDREIAEEITVKVNK